MTYYARNRDSVLAKLRARRAGTRLPDLRKKLTDAEVADIRRRYGPEKSAALALEFGVTQTYISALCRQDRRALPRKDR